MFDRIAHILLTIILGGVVLSAVIAGILKVGDIAQKRQWVVVEKGFDDRFGSGAAVIIMVLFALFFCALLGGAILQSF